MTITGIPLHPLVVHAAVVFAPVAALAAILYAALPGRRAILRHATATVAVLAALTVQVAAMTGDSLAHALGPGNPLIHDHEVWAGRLQVASWALAGVAAVGWWAIPAAGAHGGRGGVLLHRAALVLLPLAGVAVLVLVVLTGHSGATAVWKGVGA